MRLVKDSPAHDLVVVILETFLLPVDKQYFEVIVVIRSILMYREKLQKLIPKEFTRLIECLSKKVCLLTGSVISLANSKSPNPQKIIPLHLKRNSMKSKA